MSDTSVCIVGLGYTGLPLAQAAYAAGFATVGYDIDEKLCEKLSEIYPFKITPVMPFSADAVFICVPTLFTDGPDLTPVQTAARGIMPILKPGMIVILQSTSYPGTTTEIVQPILEMSGLKAGHDFALAYSPERIDPGNPTWHIQNTPRIVGGVNEMSTEIAAALIRSILSIEVHTVSSPKVAEFTKILENSYRLINIGFINEMAQVSNKMGIDINEAITAASTKPHGFQPFYPGPGPGGACIPEDPLYLSWKARTIETSTRMIDTAAEINQGMAQYITSRIMHLMNRIGMPVSHSSIHCIGVSYKRGVPDLRHSRALRVMELLADAGATLSYSDPLVPTIQILGQELSSVHLQNLTPKDIDLLVLLVDTSVSLGDFALIPIFDATYTAQGPNVEHL